MIDWYGIYNYLCIVFYSVAIFTPFFVLGGIRRFDQAGKGSIIVGFLLALTYIISAVPLLALILTLILIPLGFISGRFLNLNKERYQFTIIVGLIAAICDTFWPSRLVFFSPLTVNRPTIIALIRSGCAEIVGYPEYIGAPKVEIQIAITLAGFFITLLVVLGIMKFVKRGTQQMALILASSIVVLTLLPFNPFILLAMLCMALIGVYANQSGFTPYFLRSLSFRGTLVIFAAYIALYHFRYAEELINVFGGLSDPFWGAASAIIGIFSLLVGLVIARSGDF